MGASHRGPCDRPHRDGPLQPGCFDRHVDSRRPCGVRGTQPAGEAGFTTGCTSCPHRQEERAIQRGRPGTLRGELRGTTARGRGDASMGGRRGRGRARPAINDARCRRAAGRACGAARRRRTRGRPARDRVEAAVDYAARHRDGAPGAHGRRDQAQREDHREHARNLRRPVQSGRRQPRPGGHAIRAPARSRHSGEANHRASERPLACAGRRAVEDRGPDSWKGRSGHRSAEQVGQPGHHPRGAGDCGVPRRHPRAGARPGQRRLRGIDRGRPHAHAAPAHRRRHRTGQERVHQRPDHQAFSSR